MIALLMLMVTPWGWFSSEASGDRIEVSLLSSMEASATSSITIERTITRDASAQVDITIDRSIVSRITPPKGLFSTLDAAAVTSIAIERTITRAASAEIDATIDRSTTSRLTAGKSIPSVMDAAVVTSITSETVISKSIMATMLASVGQSAVDQLPAAPSSLNAIDGLIGGQVELAWADNADNETGYEVWRSTVGPSSGFTEIQALVANSTEWTDTTSVPFTQYWYFVLANNARGDSPISNIVTITPTDEE